MLQQIIIKGDLSFRRNSKCGHGDLVNDACASENTYHKTTRIGRAHPLRGLIFHVAAKIPTVIKPLMTAAIGIDSASAPVAAHPIEQNASANVATRDEVWRRRNWLRLACTRNQS